MVYLVMINAEVLFITWGFACVLLVVMDWFVHGVFDCSGNWDEQGH